MPAPELQRELVDVEAGLQLAIHHGGAGRPIVMIHGAGAGASGMVHFAANIQAFLDAGFRVIVPDLIGYGGSSKPVDEAGYPLARFTDTLVRALDILGIGRAALFGNSLGGAIAIDMALRMPERVEATILLSPGALEDRATYQSLPKVRAMAAIFANGVNAASMRQMLESLVEDPALITDQLVAMRTALALAQPPEVASRMVLPNLAPLLPELAVPLLVIWGAEDGICPATGAERFLGACPEAKVIVLPGVGHWPMTERAEEVNAAVLSFLSDRP